MKKLWVGYLLMMLNALTLFCGISPFENSQLVLFPAIYRVYCYGCSVS